MRLEVCPGLAKRVEPGEGLLRQGATQLDLHPFAAQLEREALVRLDGDDEQGPAHVRLAEEGGAVLADDMPARAGREAAAVGLQAADPGPPVRQVVRLRQHAPDVLARREQLARCLDLRHAYSPSRFWMRRLMSSITCRND